MDLRQATPSRWRTMHGGVGTLHPGYFALVMATGIVSTGLSGRAVPALSTALMWVAVAAYAILAALLVCRSTVFAERVRRDLVDPARAFGFFTFVAGTDVLGVRMATAHHLAVAQVLLGIGAFGWLTLGYLIPSGVALGGAGRPLVAVANGTWFIWVVATQSVAVLAVCCWWITPPYWVAMGASAITVLAGARIVGMASAPALTAIHDVIVGASVVFSFATWLIPALLGAGGWRHILHRVPLRYDATLWSIVFPLGMYGVASRALGDAAHLPVVAAIGAGEIWVAAAAWAVVAAAMLVHVARALLGRTETSPS